MALAQKIGDNRNKMIVDEVKFKMEALENQIKQMKETDTRKRVAFQPIFITAY